jgi:hypothetical protein
MEEFLAKIHYHNEYKDYFQKDHSEIFKKLIDEPGHYCIIGICYFRGIGTNKDLNKAIICFTYLAERNDSYGQLYLGLCYISGLGIQKDIQKGIDYINLSASQNNHFAQNRMGMLYYNEKYVDKDLQKAFKYFILSANQGNFLAIYNLGIFYEKGIYVEKDLQKAIHYYKLMGKEEGRKRAVILLDQLVSFKNESLTIDKTEICNICYDSLMNNNRDIFTFRCSHSFHYSCLQKWAMKCPYCFIEVY